MSRGLASPPPKITSVPAAGAGSPLERWKSEDAFHQDPGGGDCLARPPLREGNKWIGNTTGTPTPARGSLRQPAQFLLHAEPGVSFFKANRLSEPLTGFFPASGASGSEEDEARNRRGWRKPPSLLSGSLDAGYGQETERRLCPMTSGPLYLRGGCFDGLEKTLRSTNILAPTLKITGDRTVSLGGPITTGGVHAHPAPGAHPQPTRYWLCARPAPGLPGPDAPGLELLPPNPPGPHQQGRVLVVNERGMEHGTGFSLPEKGVTRVTDAETGKRRRSPVT